ncbi:putative vacuolar protein sorting-associated protein 70 [Triangularia setosa]|uniref:Vacuolar protein sorting-associated protein 70 n=1 Tax=Triangularia setosa TaxID=2587417 RepID=A0AAN6WH20_9PEZI|nr:putative vacuolar protein sorting-associated protein 70 [Podospora setosa]
MASEHEPLKMRKTQTAQPFPQHYAYIPPRPRPHSVIRRFCTIALASTLIWILIAPFGSILSGKWSISHPYEENGRTWPGHHSQVDQEELRQILRDVPSSERAMQWSHYYTSGPHLAGKNYSQALLTKQRWADWGIESYLSEYVVYLNYPVDHRLALLKEKKGDDGAKEYEVSYEASLVEDVIEEDPTTGLTDSVPTFHGYSASGNVTAPVVYVNYGTYQDFEDLLAANITLKGKIAIARYGGIFRGLKIKRAQELGMVGVILYSDPGDDGEVTDEKGVPTYPEGPARQPSSVQRGSTQFLSVAPGDPTTPGYPSKPWVPRQPVETAIPSIPSLPISYTDALPILKALNGHGPKAKDFNQWWTRNTGLGYKGIEYNIGPTPDDVVVNLYNEQEYIYTPIWNVIGVINGTLRDEVVVVGNHRDAWVAGGAGDPNSGSAVLNEAMRAFGEALKRGWKPRRTIVFASWDGEEYGLVGSTEWVEEFLPWLKKASVAYVNTDVGVRGKRLSVAASPILNQVIYTATSLVGSANQTLPGQTVYDLWDKKIKTMGSGSDFTAFQDLAGIPSIDIGFDSDRDSPVYHYHSNYDSFYWMQKYGDPDFLYHKTMAQVLGILVAEIANLPVIPFGAEDYAKALAEYVHKVEDKLDAYLNPPAKILSASVTDEEMFELRSSTRNHSSPSLASTISKHTPQTFRRSLARLRKALQTLTYHAHHLDLLAEELRHMEENGEIPWWDLPRKIRHHCNVRKVNTKYKYLERSFLYEEGLDNRPWFKHVVFAPGLWTGYSGAVFPGLMESIDGEDWTNAERWVDIIESRILNAARGIKLQRQ